MKTEQVVKEQEWHRTKAQLDRTYRDSLGMEEENLYAALEQIERLTSELESSEKREATLKQLGRMIQTTVYTGIPTQTMHDFLLPKLDCFVDHLRVSVKNIDEYFVNQVPKAKVGERNRAYEMTISWVFQTTIQLSNLRSAEYSTYPILIVRQWNTISGILIELFIQSVA